MARPFSYPEVQALGVGETCAVYAPQSEVKRKCGLYGARNKRRFGVYVGASMVLEAGSVARPCCVVERLPDPVADSELPSAA